MTKKTFTAMQDSGGNPFQALNSALFPELEKKNTPIAHTVSPLAEKAPSQASAPSSDSELFAVAMQGNFFEGNGKYAGNTTESTGKGNSAKHKKPKQNNLHNSGQNGEQKSATKAVNSFGSSLLAGIANENALKTLSKKLAAKEANAPATSKDRSRRAVTQQKTAAAQQEKRAPMSAEEEENLFSSAMLGITQMASKERIRPATAAAALAPTPEENTSVISFTIEGKGEQMSAHVSHIDAVSMSKLAAGAYPIDATLDLHGNTIIQAYGALASFIQKSYTKSCSCVLIVSGKGLNSPEGYSVLRDKVQTWLVRDPFRRVVLAFCPAHAKDGGAGAMYVLLRKYKKTAQPIRWEHTPSDADLFL